MTSRLLDVREGEASIVVPAFAFAFLCVGAQMFAVIASDTLLVSTFSLGALSRFYLVSALARVAVSLVYGALSTRVPGARFDGGFLALTAASMFASWAMASSGSRPAIYALCLLLVLLPSLLPLVAMSAAMESFHPRQARRLLPLIAAAATVGAMVVGGIAKLASGRLGTPMLLVFGGLFCIAALPLPRIIAARTARGVGDAPPTPTVQAAAPWKVIAESLSDLRTTPAISIFAANAFLASAATGFVDFAFKAELKAHYGRDEMAAFLGTFNVVAEAAVLGMQLFLTSRIVGRLGIRSALQARPVMLLPLGPLLMALPGVGIATSTKLVEVVLRLSLGGSVADLLLAPAPAAVRSRSKILAKAGAIPLGSLVAGGALSLFGADGPPRVVLAAFITATAVVTVIALTGARRAYASMLMQSLGRARTTLETSPESGALLRRELARLLAESVAAGDEARARAVLAMAGDSMLSLDDLAPALGAAGQLGADAARTALLVAAPGEGTRLLEVVPPAGDDALEREVLARARALGATAERPRLERALARGEAEVANTAAASLWAEALIGRASTERDPAVKQLRKAAIGPDSPRRASALRALGELGERRAETEILRALGSEDSSVFAEAARAAVLVEAPNAITTLVEHLHRGPHVRAAAAALALAGASAVGDLILALRTTPGAGNVRTAFVSGGNVAGTVRTARVLARLGPAACEVVLGTFSKLGYRARNAVARSLTAIPARTGRAIDPKALRPAMDLTLRYAESLRAAYPLVPAGLLRSELRHRIGETADRMLDLASACGDRALIARARAALRGDLRARGNALELLENVLPGALATRTVTLLELDVDAVRTAGGGELPALDGWLEKCRLFDRNEIPFEDPMRAVLDKLLALRESSLFTGLSGEDLYPVAEIAERITRAAGEIVVSQGDPGDALFVMVSGSLAVVRDGTKLRELGRGAAFGELALLDGAPRSATIEAVTDAELLRIPRDEFEALLDESPELARGVIRTLIGHLRGAS